MTFPHEANAVALKGIRKTVADRLGKSLSLLDKYCSEPQPSGDGEVSPTQKFLEFALAIKSVDCERAALLLDYINAELGCLPSMRVEEASEIPNLIDVSESVRNFGEYLSAIGRAQADGVLTPNEIPDVAAVMWLHITAVARQFRAMRNVMSETEDGAIRSRIGPKRVVPRYLELRRATA